MYKKPITIKEVNRYLSQVIDELQKKHTGVSNNDFDLELEKITGIRWKQVKNYRNHPEQFQIIRENSKIKDFVLKKRKADLFYKVKVFAPYVCIIVLVITTFRFLQYQKHLVNLEKITNDNVIKPIANKIPYNYFLGINVTEIPFDLVLGQDAEKLKAVNWNFKFKGEISTYILLLKGLKEGEINQILVREKEGKIFQIELILSDKKLKDRTKNQLFNKLRTFKKTSENSWSNGIENVTIDNEYEKITNFIITDKSAT